MLWNWGGPCRHIRHGVSVLWSKLWLTYSPAKLALWFPKLLKGYHLGIFVRVLLLALRMNSPKTWPKHGPSQISKLIMFRKQLSGYKEAHFDGMLAKMQRASSKVVDSEIPMHLTCPACLSHLTWHDKVQLVLSTRTSVTSEQAAVTRHASTQSIFWFKWEHKLLKQQCHAWILRLSLAE